jgi:hypothetical protein
MLKMNHSNREGEVVQFHSRNTEEGKHKQNPRDLPSIPVYRPHSTTSFLQWVLRIGAPTFLPANGLSEVFSFFFSFLF